MLTLTSDDLKLDPISINEGGSHLALDSKRKTWLVPFRCGFSLRQRLRLKMLRTSYYHFDCAIVLSKMRYIGYTKLESGGLLVRMNLAPWVYWYTSQNELSTILGEARVWPLLNDEDKKIVAAYDLNQAGDRGWSKSEGPPTNKRLQLRFKPIPYNDTCPFSIYYSQSALTPILRSVTRAKEQTWEHIKNKLENIYRRLVRKHSLARIASSLSYAAASSTRTGTTSILEVCK